MQRTAWLLIVAILLPLTAAAQETRGNISGTVRDAQGVVPGAMVRITNIDTKVTQSLVTNDSGYFEAPLLNPGTYEATVQMTGFKTAGRSDIALGVGQQVTVPFMLEVGAITEEIVVRAQAPLLDTSAVSSGANFDTRLVDSLPMFSNMPITLSRFSPGLNVNDAQTNVSQGYVDNTSLSAGSLLGLPLAGTQNPLTPPVGGNNYTLDGANNNGSNRRIAASPNADMIQEMRVESANFDASVGHGLGLQISMMTRAGTARQRGTVNYQYWSNKFNSLTEQQKTTFDDRAKSEFEKGRSHNLSLTAGGPVRIPGVLDGRGKLFYFANYSLANDAIPGKIQGSLTIPANEKHLQGDFSDLLRLPNPAQYQIYDPLTTRPDPANPSRMVRDPFPNNVIPRDRIFNPDGTYKNPLMALYSKMIPKPNQNFIENGQQPNGNFYRGGEPDSPKSQQYGFRLDFTPSSTDRFFFRTSGITFLEYVSDWTYLADPDLRIHSADRSRYQWSYTGTWTRTMGSTVLDSSFATNRFNQIDEFRGLKKFTPTDVGLPAYLDDFCSTRGGCTLPNVGITGYQGFGGGLGDGDTATHIQGQSNITSIRGRHTLHGGIDVRRAQRDRTGGGNRSGQLGVRPHLHAAVQRREQLDAEQPGSGAGRLRTGAADVRVHQRHPAIELQQLLDRCVRSGHLASGPSHGQRGSTLRIRDRRPRKGRPHDRRLRSDGQTRHYRCRAGGLPGQRPSEPGGHARDAHRARRARSTPTRLGSPAPPTRGARCGCRASRRPTWSATARCSKAATASTTTRLNAADYVAAQAGYSVTTTSTISDDLGRTFKWATPATGAKSFDPFPIRADGTRWDPVVGDALGVNSLLGGTLSTENGLRDHARQQRWRVSLQRQFGASLGVEVAYAGAYNDQLPVSIRQDYLPEQYWDGSNLRNTAANTYLTAQVTNPFFINNFASLRVTDPVLYQRLASNPTFSSATIQRNRLLRPFGELTNLTYANLPLGAAKSHSLEVQVNRRFSNGLSGFMSFIANRVRYNRTVEEYDREPTLWQGSNDARPWRLAGVASYELPFGRGRRFLNNGGVLAAFASNWQVSGTWEYQPGALLDWGAQNIFFTGNLDDIALDDPTREEWFNTDAGFERDPAKIPAAFQKRAFPFRIDGVRGMPLTFTNMSIQRNFGAGNGRTWQLRMDAQNVFNRQQWQGPTLNPTSTQFGQVTTVAANQMRFFTFGVRTTF